MDFSRGPQKFPVPANGWLICCTYPITEYLLVPPDLESLANMFSHLHRRAMEKIIEDEATAKAKGHGMCLPLSNYPIISVYELGRKMDLGLNSHVAVLEPMKGEEELQQKWREKQEKGSAPGSVVPPVLADQGPQGNGTPPSVVPPVLADQGPHGNGTPSLEQAASPMLSPAAISVAAVVSSLVKPAQVVGETPERAAAGSSSSDDGNQPTEEDLGGRDDGDGWERQLCQDLPDDDDDPLPDEDEY